MSAPSAAVRTRVLVVDDHPLFRQGVCQFLNRQRDLQCCGTADSVASALEAVRRERPAVVLADLRLHHEDASTLIRRVRDQVPSIKVVVLSNYDEEIHAERVLKAGAHGYVMKEAATSEVLHAIHTVLAGNIYVSRKVAVRVLERVLVPGESAKTFGVEGLSPREFEIYQLLGAGLNSHEIATRLGISFKTVQTHRENIKRKLGLCGASALVRSATRWFEGAAVIPPPCPGPGEAGVRKRTQPG